MGQPKQNPKESAQQLEGWFASNARDLPWRHTRDPYAIWVSEIMLQQTRVDTICSRFPRFLKRFPNLKALANADLDEVRAEWSGLGYYRRCENLWKGARFVFEELGGTIPTDPKDLIKIPGIGDYTASAIAAIAFDVHSAAVDGNVLRVGGRFMADTRSIANTGFKKDVGVWANSVVAEGSPPVLVQALMELGATTCMPSKAHCYRCPLEPQCHGALLADPTEVPAPKPRSKPAKWSGVVGIGICEDGKIICERRPEKGLLGGLWFLPGTIGPSSDELIKETQKNAKKRAAELYGVTIEACDQVVQASWRFSHILLEPTIVTVNLKNYKAHGPQAAKSKDEWRDEAVPTVTRHFLKAVGHGIDEGSQ